MVSAASEDGSVLYPAAYKEVIGVSTSEKRENMLNKQSYIEIFAPGKNIKTKTLFGVDILVDGTSFAVPYVVGQASLLWNINKEDSNKVIREKLHSILQYDSNTSMSEYNINKIEKYKTIYSNNNESKNNCVTAMWDAKLHKTAIVESENEFCFTLDELKIIKAGATYPDKEVSGFKYMEYNPEWHGYYKENYVASYIFATKIAKYAGDTSNLKKVNGLSDNAYNRMKSAITTTKISGKKWDDIIKDETGLNYTVQNSATKKEWRRLFLYGMSIHVSTDVFAHSAYTKETNGSIIELTHTRGADNPDIYKNRAKCAKNTAYYGLINVEENILGEIIDFAVDETALKGFYIRGIINNCIAVKESYTTESEIKQYFKYINY